MEIKLSKINKQRISKQVVYISPNASRVFLNREACEQLGLISESFPNVEISYIEDCFEVNDLPNSEIKTEPECNCPRHTLPPELPKTIPFDKKDLEKLKKILKDWIL